MKQYFFAVLITLVSLFAPASEALAQTGSSVVHIEQAFVVGGQALAAGDYRVTEWGGSNQVLTLRGLTPGVSVFLLPVMADAPASGPSATLTLVDDVYHLTEIATERGVYRLAVRVPAAHAANPDHSTSAAGKK